MSNTGNTQVRGQKSGNTTGNRPVTSNAGGESLIAPVPTLTVAGYDCSFCFGRFDKNDVASLFIKLPNSPEFETVKVNVCKMCQDDTLGSCVVRQLR